MEHVANGLEKKWENRRDQSQRLDMDDVLGELATQYGVAKVGVLGIFIRSSAFVIGLVARSLGARKRAERTVLQYLEDDRRAALAAERVETKKQKKEMEAQQKAERKADADAETALKDNLKTRLKAILTSEGVPSFVVPNVIDRALRDRTLEELTRLSTAEELLHGALAQVLATESPQEMPISEIPISPREKTIKVEECLEGLHEQLSTASPSHDVVTSLLASLPWPPEHMSALRDGQMALGTLHFVQQTLAPLLVEFSHASAPRATNRSTTDSTVVLDHIRSLIAECDIDMDIYSPLLRLAAVEQQLQQQLSIERFEQLDLPEPTFLGFCCANAAQLEVWLPSTSKEASTLRMSSLLFATQCARHELPLSTESGGQRALWHLCQEHFGVVDICELGWASVDELFRYASSGAEANARIPTACGLVTDLNRSGAGCGVLGPMTAEDARLAIHSAPPLEDLAHAIHWKSVFAPELGALSDFLLPSDVPVLESSHGKFVKLVPGDTADFRVAARQLEPVLAAAIACSIVCNAGGVANAPLSLLGGFTARALEAALDGALSFTLQALSSLPDPLLGPIGVPVFLEPAKAVLPGAISLLVQQAAANSHHLRVMHKLGYQSGEHTLLVSLMTSLREKPAPSRASSIPPALASVPEASAVASKTPISCEADCGAVSEVHQAAEAELLSSPDDDATTHISDGLEGELATSEALCLQVAASYGGGLEDQLDSPGATALRGLRELTERAITRLAGELYAGK